MIAELEDLEPVPVCPPDGLGRATHLAALLVDRAAVQLLTACGPYDPAAERRQAVALFLDQWPALERAVQALAAEAVANDNAGPVTRQRVNTTTRQQGESHADGRHHQSEGRRG